MGRNKQTINQGTNRNSIYHSAKEQQRKKNMNTMRMNGWADLRRSGLARFGFFRDLDWTGYFLDSTITMCI